MGFDPAATTKPVALFNDCILTTAREELIPLLISAPEWQDHSFLEVIKNLCSLHRDVEFLISTEGRCNVRELCTAVNQQANLTLFGPCHWSNSPKGMTDDHRLFLELLGLSSIPVASGAQTLEELLGRWAHGRWILGRCLQEEYRRLWRTGWRPTAEEIERDIARLLNDNFWNLSNPVIEEVSADETEEEA